MRWMHTAEPSELSLRGDRFRSQVVQIAATLRDMAVEDLVGEEVAQHRRMLRIRNAAIGLLAALTIAALTLAGVAVAQRRSAIQSADEANRQRLVAERETALAERQLMTATALRVNSEAQAMLQRTRAGGSVWPC